jgi:hypothetical protein
MAGMRKWKSFEGAPRVVGPVAGRGGGAPLGKIDPVRAGKPRASAPGRPTLKLTPTSREAAVRVPMRRPKSESRGAAQGKAAQGYVEETLQNGPIVAAGRGGSSYYSPNKSACVTSVKDPVTGKKRLAGPRKDQVDLIFAPRGIPKQHSDRPAPAGPALRFCSPQKRGFGPVVVVRDPRKAKEIAAKYQACARAAEGTGPALVKALEACVAEATGSPAEKLAFGGRRKRR